MEVLGNCVKVKGDSGDSQYLDPLMGSGSHKGVPLLGVPENPTEKVRSTSPKICRLSATKLHFNIAHDEVFICCEDGVPEG